MRDGAMASTMTPRDAFRVESVAAQAVCWAHTLKRLQELMPILRGEPFSLRFRERTQATGRIDGYAPCVSAIDIQYGQYTWMIDTDRIDNNIEVRAYAQITARFGDLGAPGPYLTPLPQSPGDLFLPLPGWGPAYDPFRRDMLRVVAPTTNPERARYEALLAVALYLDVPTCRATHALGGTDALRSLVLPALAACDNFSPHRAWWPRPEDVERYLSVPHSSHHLP